MATDQSAVTPSATHPGRAPLPRKSRRRPATHWIVHGVLLVALAAGVYGLLPRLGGLTHDAAGLRHARPAFLVAAIVQPGFGPLAVAYGAANIASAIPLTPGGLGVIEVTLVAVTVGLGAPRSTAVLAVLGYRIMNYWLPLLPGAVAYLRVRFRTAANGKRTPSRVDSKPNSADPKQLEKA